MTTTRTCPTCGYSRTYARDRQADSYFARHRCDKQQRRTEAARRRAQLAAGGTRRDCHHDGHPHQHGTRTAYVKDRCRCRDCMDANTEASRRTNRARTFGRWQPYIDAAPARDHIHYLRANGLGMLRIAELAGTSRSTLQQLTGTGGLTAARRIRAETAERILAIRPDITTVASNRSIDATGTRRRLQALMAIGWPLPELTAHANRSGTPLGHRTLSDVIKAHTVRASTARIVAALYDQLWDQPAPRATDAQRAASAKARASAHEHGWPPPLAWDDIDTDPDPDPTTPQPADPADIDHIAVERGVAGDGIRLEQLTPAEQAEVVRRLTERGKSIRDIAAQLATTTRTVSRKRVAISAA